MVHAGSDLDSCFRFADLNSCFAFLLHPAIAFLKLGWMPTHPMRKYRHRRSNKQRVRFVAFAAHQRSIPSESVSLIVRYVGAHNLETIWPCSECNPYWYNWYCHECQKTNTFLYWSQRWHHGHCGQGCCCCRSELGADCGCPACDDLWRLKATCHTMRDLLKTYNGT